MTPNPRTLLLPPTNITVRGCSAACQQTCALRLVDETFAQ
jgi:hypothetical protein